MKCKILIFSLLFFKVYLNRCKKQRFSLPSSIPFLTSSWLRPWRSVSWASQWLWAASGPQTVKALYNLLKSLHISWTIQLELSCYFQYCQQMLWSTYWLRERVKLFQSSTSCSKPTSDLLLLWVWKSYQYEWRLKYETALNSTRQLVYF